MKKVLLVEWSDCLTKYLIQNLCQKGYEVVILAKHISNFSELKCCGFPGQISHYVADCFDIFHQNSEIANLIQKSDIVINMLESAESQRSAALEKACVFFPQKLASLCHLYHKKFIHISANITSIAQNLSPFAICKLKGEDAVLESNENAIIVRPNLIIGAGDNLLESYKILIQYLTIVPFNSFDGVKFSPIYAGDLARVISEIASRNDLNERFFSISGLETTSVKSLIKKMAKIQGKRTFVIPIPRNITKFLLSIQKLLPPAMRKINLHLPSANPLNFEHATRDNALTQFVKIPTKLDQTLRAVVSDNCA